MNKSFLRTGGILVAFVLGGLLPQLHGLSFLIRYLIMGMLFLVFLRVRPTREALTRRHLLLATANLALGPLWWGVTLALTGDRNLALAAFFAAITPTASAAPVVMGFLNGKVDFVVVGFLLTNVAVALGLPVILPLVIGHDTPGLMLRVFGSMGVVMGVPLLAALACRAVYPPAEKWPSRLGDFSFLLWLTTMLLIAANASDFLRGGQADRSVAPVALMSLAVCVSNFAAGYWLGGPRFRREGSQMLGQKNTGLTIYLALVYANPLVALGPTCYVLWHNLWNAFQLSKLKIRDTEVRM